MSTMEENIGVYCPSMGWDKGKGKEKNIYGAWRFHPKF